MTHYKEKALKQSHEQFLRECLGEEGVDALNKSITRQGTTEIGGLSDTYLSLMIVPRSLLSWVSQICRGMEEGSNLEVEIPGGKQSKILINKYKNDIYSGYIHRDGKIIHRYGDVTIPVLAGHLMTSLELYDDFKDNHEDSPTIIKDLVPLIDSMVGEKIRHTPPPIINININNKEPEPAPIPLPVIKEEVNSGSDSFKAGYHMAMGNYHRRGNENKKAYAHDKKLDKAIKGAGEYSAINKEEFDAGAESAASCIRKDEFGYDDEGCGCEEERDQYNDEFKELRDEKLRSEAEEEKTPEQELMDEGVEKQEGVNPPAPTSSPSKQKELNPLPPPEGKDMKKYEMTKAEIDSRCPDCDAKEFDGEIFIGCICMSPMRNSGLKVIKSENGKYELNFGRGWDKENIEILLDVLRRRNG